MVFSMIVLQMPLDARCVKMLTIVTITSTMHGATVTAGTTIEKINANRLVRVKFVFSLTIPTNFNMLIYNQETNFIFLTSNFLDEYTKVDNGVCVGEEGYATLNEAKRACSLNSGCIGVLDEACGNTTNSYFACSQDLEIGTKVDSCVHKKHPLKGI